MLTGSCLCGSVAFTIERLTRDVLACHCTQCRKVSGHFWAATRVDIEYFHITSDEGLRWFDSSPNTKRGFCSNCGSTLFFRPDGRPSISVSAGCIDGATGLKTAQHWYVADKGDYYQLNDGVEQLAGE